MNVEDVQRRVALVKRQRNDDEAAHSLEGELHQDVLKAIAEGAENASALAAEALKTVDIDFARWCA